MLAAIQAHLRASVSDAAERLGQFTITFDPHTANPYRNYAIPDDGVDPANGDLADLVDWFTRRERMPRLEYVAPAPALAAALSSAGFVTTAELPLMMLGSAGPIAPPVSDGVAVEEPTTRERLHPAAQIQNAAYGEADATDADVDRLLGNVAAGGGVVLATVDGQPAGAGLFTPPRDGLSELAAVGVAEAFRGRGVATAVSYALTRAVLAANAVPYLQAEPGVAPQVYARIGFERLGDLTVAERR